MFYYAKLLLFSVALSLTNISPITSETIADNYDPSKSVPERSNNVKNVCSKYDDELKYEYNDLYHFPADQAKYQAHVDHRYVDNVNKYYFCATGQWDQQFMHHQYRDAAYYLNWSNKTHPQIDWAVYNHTELEPKDIYKKGNYKRILVVEHPFIKLIDEYHHLFVIAKHALADLTENIVETWIKPRSDKFVKKEGKKYFETTDDDPLVLTFRQFVNYLTQISSEMMYGKTLVSDYKGMTERFKPTWKKCTPCVKDSRYDFVVDVAHMNEDLQYVTNELGIKNVTDSQPFKPESYDQPERFKMSHMRIPEAGTPIMDDIAKNNKDVVKRFYSTLYKSEILALYHKYRLDFELFGYEPDEFLEYGMEDATSRKL